MHPLPFLATALLTSAQYLSQGWQPGQPASITQDDPAPVYTPGVEHPGTSSASPGLSELFSLHTLLTWSPVASLLEHLGVNITERVSLTRARLWDERITLITDDNFQELVVREPLTEEQVKDRVWIVIISVTAAQQDGVSKYMDQVFDSAYNETLHGNDLPNVRWGRIDYLNVTYLTTKWNVWQAPYLVVITDRGNSLRFYRPHQLYLRDHALREFLLNEGWKKTPLWESRYAPGGDREWVMHIFATYLKKLYDAMILVPRWILFIITGGIGSILINFLHHPSKKQSRSAVPGAPTTKPIAGSATVTSSAAKAISEPQDKPSALSTATSDPLATPRTLRKGKRKDDRHNQASQA